MNWPAFEAWWSGMAVADRAYAFFTGMQAGHVFDRLVQVGGPVDYIFFVLMRYLVPTVLSSPRRERLTKNDPDYWLESEQILKAATVRLRELKPLIELLTTPNPLAESAMGGPAPSPFEEVELGKMLKGIAEVEGSYGGTD